MTHAGKHVDRMTIREYFIGRALSRLSAPDAIREADRALEILADEEHERKARARARVLEDKIKLGTMPVRHAKPAKPPQPALVVSALDRLWPF